MKTALAILSFLIAIELFLLAYKFFVKKEFRHPMYITLGFICTFTAFWLLGYGIMYSTGEKETALLAYRFGSIGWTIGLSLWYVFFYELYNYSVGKKGKTIVHIIVFIIGMIFWFAALEGYIYAADLQYGIWWGWEETIKKDSFWILTYDLFTGLLVVLNLYQIIKTIHHAKHNKHMRQIRAIGIAFASITVPSALVNLLFPVFDIKLIPPIGNFLVGSAALLIGGIIIKYKVLDINPSFAASQIFFEISDYVILTDLKGQIKKVNNSALNILSFSSEEIIKKNISEISDGINIKDFNLKPGVPGSAFKTKIISAGGISIPARCKASLVTDDANDPIGYMLIMTDLRDMIAIEDLEKAVEGRTTELADKNKKLLVEITEREKAQETIINIEMKQRAMISNISDVIAILDRNGNSLYNSPNIYDIYGYRPEAVLGKEAFLIIHPDDSERAKKVFFNLVDKYNAKSEIEFRYRCFDGNYKIVHMTLLNKLNDPVINGMLVNYYDITERVESEQERLLRSQRIQKQQEALLRITNDPVFKSGNKVKAFELIVETAALVLSVNRISIWFYKNNNKELECAEWFDKSLNKHNKLQSVNTEKFPHYLKNIGNEFVVGINDALNDARTVEFRDTHLVPLGVTSLMDAGIRLSGKSIGILGFAHTGPMRIWTEDEISFAAQLADLITQAILYHDRLEMENKLRLFANTIKSVSENISITNMDDELIFVNESFCKTYGYDKEELLGRTVEILRSDKNDLKHVKNILNKTIGGGWEGELWNRKKDGTDFLIYLSTSVIKDDEGIPVALVGIATDITEKKLEEQRLFNLFSFQSEMLETAAMWINTLDINGNITFWNRAAEKISGYSRDEVLYKNNIWDYLYPDTEYRKLINKEMEEIIRKDKRLENFQTVIQSRHSGERVISWYSNNLTDENNSLIGSIAIGIDFTDKKKAEDLLRENEEKYRILLDESTDPIFSFNSEGRYLYANRAFVKGVGKKIEDVVGNTLWDVFPKEEADIRFDDVKQVFATRISKSIDVRVPRPDGDHFYLTSITPIINSDNKVLSVICSSKEITDRKKAEDALRVSEQRLRLHFEQTPLGVIEWDKKLKVVSWNKAAERIFGYSTEESIGKDADFIVPENIRNHVDSVMFSLIEEKGVSKSINENLTKNGNIILCEWYNTVLTDLGGETIGVASLVMDITARKEAELEQNRLLDELKSSQSQIENEAVKLAELNEQLIDSEIKLKELNASKDKFFSIIAHDLKSPFLSLLGYSEILSNEFDELSEGEKKESIQSIYQLSNNSYRLLENLLQWSRIQIGKIEFVKEPFNLFYELSPALMLLTQTAKNKNITIENNIDRKVFVTADKNMLNTIIRNLVSNAIKFTNKGGKIVLTAVDEENLVRISVKDNGIGLEKEQISNLFSIDKNISTNGTANETGTGLGLLLCKEMIEKHSGSMLVNSSPDSGSEFVFTIPK